MKVVAAPAWRLVAPYVVWMALMAVLPQTAWAYAVRSAATLAVLVAAFALKSSPNRKSKIENRKLEKSTHSLALLAGLGVWALWVLPENFAWYREWCIIGVGGTAAAPSPYDPAVCGWPLTLARLAGSALVIPAAEELFFRGWLFRWLGADKMAFVYVVLLFALEHDRIVVAAIAGVVYALLAVRRNLASAIVAHSVTNLALGLQVILARNWAFW